MGPTGQPLTTPISYESSSASTQTQLQEPLPLASPGPDPLAPMKEALTGIRRKRPTLDALPAVTALRNVLDSPDAVQSIGRYAYPDGIANAADEAMRAAEQQIALSKMAKNVHEEAQALAGHPHLAVIRHQAQRDRAVGGDDADVSRFWARRAQALQARSDDAHRARMAIAGRSDEITEAVTLTRRAERQAAGRWEQRLGVIRDALEGNLDQTWRVERPLPPGAMGAAALPLLPREDIDELLSPFEQEAARNEGPFIRPEEAAAIGHAWPLACGRASGVLDLDAMVGNPMVKTLKVEEPEVEGPKSLTAQGLPPDWLEKRLVCPELWAIFDRQATAESGPIRVVKFRLPMLPDAMDDYIAGLEKLPHVKFLIACPPEEFTGVYEFNLLGYDHDEEISGGELQVEIFCKTPPQVTTYIRERGQVHATGAVVSLAGSVVNRVAEDGTSITEALQRYPHAPESRKRHAEGPPDDEPSPKARESAG